MVEHRDSFWHEFLFIVHTFVACHKCFFTVTNKQLILELNIVKTNPVNTVTGVVHATAP